jgi:KDO2-lipid IV(A) lauroyltransferase
MARPSPLVAWSQYAAARAAVAALTCLDIDSDLHAAAQIGRWLYRLDRRHRARALQSVAWAFPHLAPPQAQRLVERSFEHFAMIVVEACYTPRLMQGDTWSRRISLGNLGEALALLNAGKPLLMLTGHYGNWELLGYLLATLGYPVSGLARPLDNPLVNDWLMGIRERRGLRIITKWDATQRMQEVLDEGGVLGFIADQNAGDRGLFVPFFGRLASTYKSIALLAMARELPIVCGYARRLGRESRYGLGVTDVISPAQWADQPDPLYYITARYIRAIEQMVREAPEQYLWMHRRWKSRPRFEREGKAMPASLRRQLEQLPWMDQAAMEQLLDNKS